MEHRLIGRLKWLNLLIKTITHTHPIYNCIEGGYNFYIMDNPNCIANCTKELIENNLCDCYNKGEHPLNKPKEKMESNFVTSGRAAWLVAVIFVILAILFSGCNYINVSNPQVISDTRKDSGNTCIYYWNATKADDPKNINCSFRDTCYKYMIGDTVIFKTFKK